MTENFCNDCRGPCRVPEWVRDGSWYSNNPYALAGAIARAHRWFEPARLLESEQNHAAARALVLAPTFPCSSCGKFAFHIAGVVCHWCTKAALTAAAA